MSNNKRVFLGGTCPGWNWRKELISMLKINYFNPVVKVWNDQAKKNELYERQNCDFCLYVITPYMKGVYSIAEVIDDSNKHPEKTIFCFVEEEYGRKFGDKEKNSLNEVGKMVQRNGGKYFTSLEDVAEYMNNK